MSQDELHMTKVTPWGVGTLITLVFRDKGYALVTADNRYLATDGSLEKSCSENTLFTIEFFSGNIAFKSKKDGRFVVSCSEKESSFYFYLDFLKFYHLIKL